MPRSSCSAWYWPWRPTSCWPVGHGTAAVRSASPTAWSSRPTIRSSAPTLRSQRLGLVGRCDHLLRVGGAYVPVEQKPSSRRLQQSHILQVGALCMLVHEVYGVRPPYGVVVLAGGAQERVAFTEELERGVLRTMAQMRRMLENGEAPGPRWVPAKCRACGYHPVCWGEEDVGAAGDQVAQRVG